MPKGCFLDIAFFVMACFVPILFFLFIPYIIGVCYYRFKEWKNMEEADAMLKQTLSNMTPVEIEMKRIELIDLMNNPYAPEGAKKNAAYAIRFIEKHYMGL